jgi:hypothetical protein
MHGLALIAAAVQVLLLGKSFCVKSHLHLAC